MRILTIFTLFFLFIGSSLADEVEHMRGVTAVIEQFKKLWDEENIDGKQEPELNY